VHLALDGLHERRIGLGIVEVREHEVLPDENAELVAEVMEGRRLVRAGAGNPQHVEPTGADQLERGSQIIA
jgi:hypothetical protein